MGEINKKNKNKERNWGKIIRRKNNKTGRGRKQRKEMVGRKRGGGRKVKEGGSKQEQRRKRGYLWSILILIVVSIYNTYCKNKTVDFQAANKAVWQSAKWKSWQGPGRPIYWSHQPGICDRGITTCK